MTTLMQFHSAASAQILALDLAAFVADRLRESLSRRGRALLIVSGGGTPLPFFDALAQLELDWSRVTVTLADERWLPPDHADSNERLVRAHLLQGPAAKATFVPIYTGEATPLQAQGSLETSLAALPWPADAVVLGMGSDGHTASLFPHAPELPTALDVSRLERCLAVATPTLPNVPVPRISLTRRALLDARALIIHVTGQGKWSLLQQAQQVGPIETLPIRLAWQQSQVPCHVFYAD